MSEIPDKWRDLMDRAGYTSLRKLSDACGGNPTAKTVADIILRGKRGSDESVAKIAAALRVSVADLNGIRTGHSEEPLRLPLGTERLSVAEKEAVQVIIRALVKTKEQAYGQHEDEKKIGPPEPVAEKTNVTPIGGRKMTPLQRKFELTGRRVARVKREVSQDSRRIDPSSTSTDE